MINIKVNIKKIVVLVIVLLLILSSIYILNSNDKAIYINKNKVESIIIKQSNPPMMKIADKKEDIDILVNFLNSLTVTKIEGKDINLWEMLIEIKGKDSGIISFTNDKICVDEQVYKVHEQQLQKLKSMYKNLDYKEEVLKK